MGTNINVRFLRGQSSALSTLSAPSDGVFYLTEDTKKLNIGLLNNDGTTSIYELNKDITIIDKKSSLEDSSLSFKKGQFIYIEKENIFSVYTGSGFLQINPDTGMTEINDNRDDKTQPITKVSYDSNTRKLTVHSEDTFVKIADFEELTAIVNANKIIGGVSSEFTISNNEEKVLSINSISQNKVTGLETTLGTKVDRKTSLVTETVNGETVSKEVEWTLVSPTDQAKLAALVVNEDGTGVEISGKVNATNVEGLSDWVSGNRDIIDGLLSVQNANHLASIESGAQVNIAEIFKIANKEVSIVDKTVNIPMASPTALFPGVVMSSNAENHVKVDENGLMRVNSLNVNQLVQTEGELFVINGGNSSF